MANVLPLLTLFTLNNTPSSFESILHLNQLAPQVYFQASQQFESIQLSYARPLHTESSWIVGLNAGYQRESLKYSVFNYPALQYSELSFGHYLLKAQGEARDTGFRGYLETIFRYRKISLQSMPEFIKDGPEIGFRVGAGNDPDGEGIVAQKPQKITFNILSYIYIPLHIYEKASIGTRGRFLYSPQTYMENYDFGPLLGYHLVPNYKPSVSPFYSQKVFEYGLSLRYRKDRRMAFIADISQPIGYLNNTFYFEKFPLLKLYFAIAF